MSGNECAEWRFESLVPFVLKDALLDMSEMLLSISVTIYHVLKLENSNKWKSQNMSSINLMLISFIDYLDTCVCVYCLLLHSHLTRYTRRHGGVLPARALQTEILVSSHYQQHYWGHWQQANSRGLGNTHFRRLRHGTNRQLQPLRVEAS